MLSEAVGWALPELRAEAEANMLSVCTIRGEATGEPTTDPDTGRVTPAEGAPIYSGPCRVRPAGTQADSRESGGTEVFMFDYVVSVPVSVTAVIEGMLCHIDASPDAALVGVNLEIQQVARGEQITARRLACSEVS